MHPITTRRGTSNQALGRRPGLRSAPGGSRARAVRQKMEMRRKTLQDLIELRKPLAELRAILAEFEWDCDQELVQLERQHLADVLKRYISGEISAEEVEKWANLIECRDDIDYAEVAEFLHVLANPLLTDVLTPSVGAALMDKLKTSNASLEPSR